jgi:hypothetical protein
MPPRFTMRQLLHIRFTDALTFMACFSSGCWFAAGHATTGTPRLVFPDLRPPGCAIHGKTHARLPQGGPFRNPQKTSANKVLAHYAAAAGNKSTAWQMRGKTP